MSDMSLDVADGEYSAELDLHGTVLHEGTPLVAGGFPVKPPKTWFSDPNLPRITPLTILSSGQAYGHIAAWRCSHIGLAGGVKPPRSKSNYAFYRTGVVETAEGDMVDVGQITLAGGHAPLDATVAHAVAHYDDTRSAVLDVAAGEDKHGIWVAGALRPNVTEEQLRTLRASSVSGDWRPINGRLELVAVCAVNAPGFPIPRARVAAGAPLALVAAGVEPIIEETLKRRAEIDIEASITAGLETFRERISHLEKVLLARGGGVDASEKAEELRRRVHMREGKALGASAGENLAEILRKRVHGA